MLRWDFLGNFKEGVAPVGITHDGEMFVLMMGASITNSLVDTSTKREAFESQLKDAGYQVKVFDYATGGDKVNTLLTKVRDDGMIDAFIPIASKTQCVVHIGGNDASSGAYPQEAVEMDTKLRELVTWLQDRNFNVVLSPISYRVPPASNPAEPYNTNIVEPIISEFTPEWVSDGVPVYNLHKYLFDNQHLITPDGIHLTEDGKEDTRVHVGNVIIDNITQNTNTDTQHLEHVLLNFGNLLTAVAGDYCNIEQGAYISNQLVNTNFSGITNGTQIVASSGSTNWDGRSVTTNITPTVYNSSLIRRGIYGDTISLDFSNAGLDPTASYTVKFTASRNSTTGTRWGEVTVNGVTQDIDAEQNPPTVLEWSGVNGADLASSGLISTVKAGSTHMYMNGMEIIKE